MQRAWFVVGAFGALTGIADARFAWGEEGAEYNLPMAPATGVCPVGLVCHDSCDLPQSRNEKPSRRVLAALASIGKIGHHVDSKLGPEPFGQPARFEFIKGRTASDWADAWLVDGKYAGPCTDLSAVFESLVIDDADDKNGQDVLELRYRSTAAAERAGRLLERPSWTWRKYPYWLFTEGRSVFVVVGRHRAITMGIRTIRHLARVKPAIDLGF